jgi:hypothetical protein
MQVKSFLSAAFGSLAFALVTTAAQAGPSGLGTLDQTAGRSGLVEKVTWYGYGYRRPYYGYGWYRGRHYGHRHYGYGHYGYRKYGHRHYKWYPRYGYRHW